MHRRIFVTSALAIITITVAILPLHIIRAPDGATSRVLGASDNPGEVLMNTVVKTVEPTTETPLSLTSIKAKSILVYDVSSGKILAERNSDLPLPIASLTKLMTAYVAYAHADLNDQVTVQGRDIVTISPVLGIGPGETVTVENLFNSMLIGSANDAAQILGNYIGTKEKVPFTTLMNATAADLGMKDTHYSNPLGFDSDTNYSTANDMRLLVDATRRYKVFSEDGRKTSYQFKTITGNTYSVKATNKLLNDPEISAIKTGFTDEALGSMITEINHNGNAFIIIVIGSPDREYDTLALKKSIIKHYQWPQ